MQNVPAVLFETGRKRPFTGNDRYPYASEDSMRHHHMNHLCRGSTLILLVAAGSGKASAEVSIGSYAPPIKVIKWIQGAPVASGPGTLRVIEFWATWCRPCQECIPHLTDLSKQYAGKVSFVGIDVWEHSRNDVLVASRFVQSMGSRMSYSVAVDTASGDSASRWLTAAHQDTIPSAFIVDEQGRIVWIGHPMEGLNEALKALLDHTYDVAAEKRRFQASVAQNQDSETTMALVGQAAKVYRSGRKAEAVAMLDGFSHKNPAKKRVFTGVKFAYLFGYDEPAALALAKNVAKDSTKSGQYLVLSMAQAAAYPDPIVGRGPDPVAAVHLAETARAMVAKPGVEVLYILAQIYFSAHMFDKAVTTENAAITCFMASPQSKNLAERQRLFAELARFKSAMAKK